MCTPYHTDPVRFFHCTMFDRDGEDRGKGLKKNKKMTSSGGQQTPYEPKFPIRHVGSANTKRSNVQQRELRPRRSHGSHGAAFRTRRPPFQRRGRVGAMDHMDPGQNDTLEVHPQGGGYTKKTRGIDLISETYIFLFGALLEKIIQRLKILRLGFISFVYWIFM